MEGKVFKGWDEYYKEVAKDKREMKKKKRKEAAEDKRRAKR